MVIGDLQFECNLHLPLSPLIVLRTFLFHGNIFKYFCYNLSYPYHFTSRESTSSVVWDPRERFSSKLLNEALGGIRNLWVIEPQCMDCVYMGKYKQGIALRKPKNLEYFNHL